MSNIPNSAMPRAGDFTETEGQSQSSQSALSGQSNQLGETGESGTAFSQLADKAREYPKATIAAGAAVAAGVVAAAAVGIRSRSGGKGKKNSA